MFTPLALAWIVGSIVLLAVIALARRRRGALARELHELRGALTAARLAVDLMPMIDLDRPGAFRAASEELERSYSSLSDFEHLLHARLVAPSLNAQSVGALRARRARFDARSELDRLALIWGEAAQRGGRELRFEWDGPAQGVHANGPRRRFVEVVANLLANAVQHGAGRIDLTARVRSDHLRIEVTDQGPGLAAPTARLLRRVPKGMHGHGLSVARRAATALGGGLHSAPSAGGARFVFKVPALHDPTAATIDDVLAAADRAEGRSE